MYLLYLLHITIFGRFHHNVHLIVKYYNVQFMYLFIKVTIVIPFLLQIQIVVPFTLHITFLCFPYYEIRLLYRNYLNCCTFLITDYYDDFLATLSLQLVGWVCVLVGMVIMIVFSSCVPNKILGWVAIIFMLLGGKYNHSES